MPTLTFRTTVDAPVEEVFAWHRRPGALERLLPPWETIRVVERSGTIEDGARVVLELRKGPLPLRWVAVHRDYEKNRRFRDVQQQGPFAKWVHTHCFEPQGPDRCAVEDRIDYELPLGGLGRLLGGGTVQSMLERMFRFRHLRLRHDLARHQVHAGRKRLRVAVTGSTGLVGTSLCAFLTTGGHEVLRLVRRAPRPGADEVRWDPQGGAVDTAVLEGLDAVVHLAGKGIASGRWNAARKAAIRESRVEGTRCLCEALAGLQAPPRVLAAASAIGFYGDRGDEPLDEASAPGKGFLPEVCAAWEAAADPARAAGIRVVHPRIGVVLAAAGGALGQMLVPFRCGLGGPIGSGRQIMSWIALEDLIGAIHAALFDERLEGPVNAVSPHAVTNAEFARTLGKVLRRPAVLPLPAAAVRAIFGQMGQELLLAGARVVPSRLEGCGFPFLYPQLEGALRDELGCRP